MAVVVAVGVPVAVLPAAVVVPQPARTMMAAVMPLVRIPRIGRDCSSDYRCGLTLKGHGA
jgi:hypothetical protein